MNFDSLIRDASAKMPDPQRTLKSLERLLREAPQVIEAHAQELEGIAKLFCYSHFLADFGIGNPGVLSLALRDAGTPVVRQHIISETHEAFGMHMGEPISQLKKNAMGFLRATKKKYLLRITFRDLLGLTDLKECMAELSALADAVTETALEIAEFILRERFGFMRDNAFAVVGLGKLGARELNYSSDIDILTVYDHENRTSTGVLTPYGIRTNKIDSHEYFCRLTEILATLLHSHTEHGTAYRVDLRLRPNGQKGPVSISLDSYRSYYEAWGKTWERIALMRSRPVAGDCRLGEAFLLVTEPFVWKRSTDYHDIGEIAALKKKIDTIFDVNDIKRGYGGIREIEFFVQTFQLLYGGERAGLRTGTLTEMLGKLLREGFLIEEDVKTLSSSYLFLRRLEHTLQMQDDIQTHSLPANPEELALLSRKMHFPTAREFLSELRLKRLMVRDMYNSLLGGTEEPQDVLLSLRDELPEDAIKDYLSFKGFRDTGAALRNITSLAEQISSGKTMRERTLLRKAIPAFLDGIMKCENRDRALRVMGTFIQKIGNHESYMDLLLQRKDTREILVSILSRSTYLSKLLLAAENLEGIFEYPDISTDCRSIQQRFANYLSHSREPFDAVREFKGIEELKAGMLFLSGALDVYAFSRTLTAIADTIIRELLVFLGSENGFAAVGLGGLGARDLSIDSDLDLLFLTTAEAPGFEFKRNPAEALLRLLSEYTAKGVAYKVDMRLRPDGSKGVLVNNVDGYEKYYLRSAHPWEIQSLLRARSIAGDTQLLGEFLKMRQKVILKRGIETSASGIRAMRKRIIDEVSKESAGYDVKNGPGGVKEIEFLTQYLQLKHVRDFPDLMRCDTVTAIKMLARYGILDSGAEELFLTSHEFLKSVDTLLRLNEADSVRTDSEVLDVMTTFLKLRTRDALIRKITDTRRKVIRTTEMLYGKKSRHSAGTTRTKAKTDTLSGNRRRDNN